VRNQRGGTSYAGDHPIRTLQGDNAEEMVKPPNSRRQSLKNMVPNFFGCPASTRACWAGEWLIVTRYANWEVYGKTQEAVARDEAFAKLYAHTTTFAELTGRNISVGVDL